MPRIPVVGIDAAEVVHWCNAKLDLIDERLQDGHAQRRLVLVIVSIALLLDNMLYMVIVPIIPDYLRNIHVWDTHIEGGQKVYANEWRTNGTGNYSVPGNKTVTKIINGVTVYEGEDAAIGFLFASKAIIQLMVNPFSGALIDKIGYDVPMTIGLLIMFFSTAVFACGKSYGILFFARSLQGVGSAFADTSGLAMIADRYTEEKERTRALGIALAFISFGCLVAPPFGGLLYEFCGKEFPFLLLALVSFTDAIMLRLVMRPIKKQQVAAGYKMPKGTPIWRLFADPYIALCAGALMMSNVSLAFLEPTISVWMMDNMKGVQEWQLGMIWLPAFFPHVAGVVLTVKTAADYPQYQWALAAAGLALEGVSCIFIPLATNYWVMMLPICTICFGIALIDTALLPTLGHLVDTRHVSVYGSIYAIADISYSMAYAFGPIIAGGLVNSVGFTGLNIGIAVSNVLYAPLLYILCYVKGSGQSSEHEQINMTDHPKEYNTYATLENDANGQIPHQMIEKPPLQETDMGVGVQPYQGNGGYEPNGIAYGQHGSSMPPYQNADMQPSYQPQQQYQQQQQHYQPQDLDNVYQPPPRPPPPRQESIPNANANPFRPAPGANPFRQNEANPFGGGMAPT